MGAVPPRLESNFGLGFCSPDWERAGLDQGPPPESKHHSPGRRQSGPTWDQWGTDAPARTLRQPERGVRTPGRRPGVHEVGGRDCRQLVRGKFLPGWVPGVHGSRAGKFCGPAGGRGLTRKWLGGRDHKPASRGWPGQHVWASKGLGAMCRAVPTVLDCTHSFF